MAPINSSGTRKIIKNFRNKMVYHSLQEFNQIPEVDFNITSSGIKIESQRLVTARFIPFDIRGKCSTCKADNAELDFLIGSEGITLMCNRLHHARFIPFDIKYPLPNYCMFRLKTKGKVFNVQHGNIFKKNILDEAINSVFEETKEAFIDKTDGTMTIPKEDKI